LILAVDNNNQNEVRRLIKDIGVSVDMIDEHRCTPLIISIANNNKAMVELLIELGADINKECEKIIPFNLACERGYNDIVKILISAGIDINKKLPRGDGVEESIIYHTIDSIRSYRLFPNSNHIEVIKTLINADTYGEIINIKDRDGNTPIMHIIREHCNDKQFMKLIHMLINMGADLNVKNVYGKTFVDLAFSNCNDFADAMKFYHYVEDLNILATIGASYQESKSKEEAPTPEAPLAGFDNMVEDSDKIMEQILNMRY
jgi:ankyrin repeat protein